MGLFRDNETNNSNRTKKKKKSQLVGGEPFVYFTSVRASETRTTREQIQLAIRAGLELGASELKVQCSNRSATLSCASR